MPSCRSCARCATNAICSSSMTRCRWRIGRTGASCLPMNGRWGSPRHLAIRQGHRRWISQNTATCLAIEAAAEAMTARHARHDLRRQPACHGGRQCVLDVVLEDGFLDEGQSQGAAPQAGGSPAVGGRNFPDVFEEVRGFGPDAGLSAGGQPNGVVNTALRRGPSPGGPGGRKRRAPAAAP